MVNLQTFPSFFKDPMEYIPSQMEPSVDRVSVLVPPPRCFESLTHGPGTENRGKGWLNRGSGISRTSYIIILTYYNYLP